MVPMENVKAGLARFVDREIAPGLSGWDKVVVAGGLAVMIKNLPNVIAKYPISATLGVSDTEVDIDTLYEAASPSVNDKMPIQIPVIGITLKIGKQELDALYKYIKEA